MIKLMQTLIIKIIKSKIMIIKMVNVIIIIIPINMPKIHLKGVLRVMKRIIDESHTEKEASDNKEKSKMKRLG